MTMHDPDTAAVAFDAQFAQRAPLLGIAVEAPEHRVDLRNLFVVCSPLAGHLPDALFDLQFESQDATFRTARPLAMRRIVTLTGQPIARVVIDWQVPGASHGVDIAVHPDHRRSGAGLAMLRAWLAVADSEHRTCTLDVIANNAARRIYERLGFVEASSDPGAAYAFMVRRCPPAKARR